MEKTVNTSDKPFYKLWWFWVIACLILVLGTMITMRQLVKSNNQGVMNLLGIESPADRGPGANMTDAEREAMREKMDNMTDEERQQMMQNRPTGGMPPGSDQGMTSN